MIILIMVVIIVRVIGIGIILVTAVIKRRTVIATTIVVVLTIIGSLRDPKDMWGIQEDYEALMDDTVVFFRIPRTVLT